jgi:hypothetical protein
MPGLAWIGYETLEEKTKEFWRATCMEIVHAWFGEERLETCCKVTRWPLTLPPTDEKLLKGLMNGDYRELSEVTGLRRFVANLAAHVATAAAIK